MKIYDIICDLFDDLGLDAVSLVEYPAISRDFLKFSEQTKNQNIKLSDEEQHIITGVALIPDQLIYRYNRDTKEEYYIRFKEDVIKKLVEKYFSDYRGNNVNLEHTQNGLLGTSNVVLLESYFINKERGICPVEFADLPNGSWIISMKIRNNDLWEDIKAGKYQGFSVEGLMSFVEDKYAENEIEEILEEFGI